jgi:hypothetical protein
MTTQFVNTLPPTAAAPQTRTRHRANLALAAECKANPGQWVQYPFALETPRFLRYRINAGLDRAFSVGFTAELRNGDVFISYNGGVQ